MRGPPSQQESTRTCQAIEKLRNLCAIAPGRKAHITHVICDDSSADLHRAVLSSLVAKRIHIARHRGGSIRWTFIVVVDVQQYLVSPFSKTLVLVITPVIWTKVFSDHVMCALGAS